jgi:peptide chain release factor 2
MFARELKKCRGFFDLPFKKERIEFLEQQMSDPHFWDDQQNAQKVIGESNELKSWVRPFEEVSSGIADLSDLYTEAEKSKDIDFQSELVKELSKLEKTLDQLEIKKMLSGELDPTNCYLSINAGAGGTESCDWVQMLARMYQRFAARRGWKCEEIDRLDGDVAGIKNITFKITGPYAYGYSKAEKGVHRLVRISPFDSNAKRHTSFASVEVTPEIDDSIEVDIKPDEIKTDTYRSSGAGGQHVNTTDSAVRMTHIPTGIVATCQNERSQIQNREMCLKMLRAKLYERKLEEKRKVLDQLNEEKREISWGSQIRSYTFQPYTLVKDTRTKYEEGNIEAVMNGEIDGFINTYLKQFG